MRSHGATDSVCADCADESLLLIERLKAALSNVINQSAVYYPEGLHPDGEELKEAKALLKELE